MVPPFLSYITWNRMGLTIRNLTRLLESPDDFEMHIIDNNSKDDTWEFINDLSDKRIKKKTRFDDNKGVVYASNYNLSERKENQYFITIDNDVYIHSLDWIPKALEVFNTFSEVGMLGVPRAKPYPEFLPPVIPKVRNGVCYLRLEDADINKPLHFVPAAFQIFRPEIFNYIGYWCEESGFRDGEISARISNYSPYRVGFLTNIHIEQHQHMDCEQCKGHKWCSLYTKNDHCSKVWLRNYKHTQFVKENLWKHKKIFEELNMEKRSAYCRSVHDGHFIEGDIYHKDWADENLQFFSDNTNSTIS